MFAKCHFALALAAFGYVIARAVTMKKAFMVVNKRPAIVFGTAVSITSTLCQ
jgi:hypothetical protein